MTITTALSPFHTVTPADLAQHLPEAPPGQIAALVDLCNDRITTALSLALDTFPTLATVFTNPVPKGHNPVALHKLRKIPASQLHHPGSDPALETQIAEAAAELHVNRQEFLQALKLQLAYDEKALTQELRNQIRAVKKQHSASIRQYRVEKATLKSLVAVERERKQLLKQQRVHAKARSSRFATKRKLKLLRLSGWATEKRELASLAASIAKQKREAANLAAEAELHAVELKQVEIRKQQTILTKQQLTKLQEEKNQELLTIAEKTKAEAIRIAEEHAEAYLLEVQTREALKLEEATKLLELRKFRKNYRKERSMKFNLARAAELKARDLLIDRRLQKANTAVARLEKHTERARQLFLDQQRRLTVMRTNNGALAIELGFDPRSPLSVWEAAERRRAELQQSSLSTQQPNQLPKESANDEIHHQRSKP